MAALMGALSWKADDLAKDPPRADWSATTVASVRPLSLDDFRALEPELAVTAELLAEAETTMAAGIVGLERAQGAQLAAEQGAATERYEESMSFFTECARSLAEAANLLGGQYAGSSHYQRFVWTGWRSYPSAGVAFAIAAGLTEVDIRPYRHVRFRVVDVSGRLNETAEEMRDFAAWLSSWAEQPPLRR
jgi:hypothetical protein